MYPFVTLCLLWLIAPIAAYVIQNQKVSFRKALFFTTGILLVWYASGYKAIGEEGDYNAWTVAWWLLNFFIFQAFRLPQNRLRDLLLTPGLVFIAGVCLWMMVIIAGNLLFKYPT
jgi:hypothetical protein